MIERYEAGTTRQFTFVSSVAPDSAPHLTVWGPGDTIVASETAQTSGSTAFYAMVTMPTSADGNYLAEWRAESTAAGSAKPYVERIRFVVSQTAREAL